MPTVIENPILNSPFEAPARHFKFDENGITDELADGRRESGYFLPIASRRKKGGQLKFETEWTQDRFQSSPRINRIRDRVAQWRNGGYVGCTRTSERLLQYWTDPLREKKLFFCQIEALETAIYIAEVAARYGDAWIENELRGENESFNGGLPRVAFKMATGSGKTVVMGMLTSQFAAPSSAFLLRERGDASSWHKWRRLSDSPKKHLRPDTGLESID